MRRLPAAGLACLLVGVLAIITPESAAVGDVLVASANTVKAAAADVREIPESGELSAEDVARLGGELEVPTEPAPEMPAGDFSTLLEEQPPQARPLARHLRLPLLPPLATKSDETLAERTEGLPIVDRGEFTTTYETSSGSFISEQSAVPLNVLGDDGTWSEISTDLDHDGSRWRVEAHPLSPSLADRANASKGVSLAAGGHGVVMTFEGAASVKGKPASSDGATEGTQDVLRFEDVLPGTDLEYEIEPGGVKETLILSKKPRAAPSWSWSIDAGDLTPVLTDEDFLELRDSTGVVKMHVPTPVAWDSSGIEGERSDALMNPDVRLEHVDGSVWRYTITVSDSWLADADRAYPVYIDPTVFTGPSLLKSYKSDGAVFNNQAHIGNTRQSNTNVLWRTLSEIYIGAAEGHFVGSAQMYIDYGGAGTTTVQPGNIYTASGACFACAQYWVDDFSIGANGVWTDGTGMTDFTAAHLIAGRQSEYFMLVGNEASVYSHKQLNTAFFMEYWLYPSIYQVAPADGAVSQSVTPTLSLSASSSSPHSPQIMYAYTVSPNADMSVPVWSSGWTPSGQATVPEAKLQPGTTYYWQGRMYDAHHGWAGQSTDRMTGVRSFMTQLVPPTPPVETAVPGNATGAPETVVTLTPTLQVDAVADPDNIPAGGTVKYEFKISTGADGKSGAVFTSGLLEADTDGKVRWTVPAGTLRDGNIYSWIV